MNTEEIFRNIRLNHQKLSGEKRNIRAPRDISFTLVDNGKVRMSLSKVSLVSNMQSNAACFEGWALVLRRWLPQCQQIVMNWSPPSNLSVNEKRHYERFLFRAKSFMDNVGWFEIDSSCIPELHKSSIKPGGKYLLNKPGKPRPRSMANKPVLKDLSESALEKLIVSDNAIASRLLKISGASQIDNQLPLGVFNGSISASSMIFTGGKSAVDIWGLGPKKKVLKLYELKKYGAEQVGILSELLFYCFVFRSLQIGAFSYPDSSSDIPKTDRIDAFFLCPSYHPLIDKALIEMLNQDLNKTGLPIVFRAIQIDSAFNFHLFQ
jgi:hypothetical protein